MVSTKSSTYLEVKMDIDETTNVSNEQLAKNMLMFLYAKMVRADFSGKDTIIQLDDGKIAFIEIVDKIGGDQNETV